MDTMTVDIEKKRELKRTIQAKAASELVDLQDKLSKDLLAVYDKTSSNLSEANVELAETQNDMRGHMPVIRYFIPNKDHQRNVVLWGLGLFAAVISLTGPLISYALAVHLNHKKKENDVDDSDNGIEDIVTIVLDDVEDTTVDSLSAAPEDGVAKFMSKRRMGYL